MVGYHCGKNTDFAHAFVSCDDEGSKDALCQFMAALSLNDCNDEGIQIKEEPIAVDTRSVEARSVEVLSEQEKQKFKNKSSI